MAAEFSNEDDIKSVAMSELAEFGSKLGLLRSVVDIAKNEGNVVSEGTFNIVIEYFKFTMLDAGNVLSKAIGNGIVDDKPFLEYVRRQLRNALLPLENKSVALSGKPPISIGGLRLHTYAQDYLEVVSSVAKEARSATPDYTKFQRDYLHLNTLPAAMVLPDIKAQVTSLPTDISTPDIAKNDSLIMSESNLNKSEHDGLVQMLKDYNSQTDTTWIEGNNDVLKNLLNLAHDLNAPPPLLRGPEELRRDLKDVLSKTNVRRMEHVANASIDVELLLKKYGLSEARAHELVDVLDSIIETAHDPTFVAWRDDLIKNRETRRTNEYYDAFLSRIEAKIAAKQVLTDDEKEDLAELLHYLSGQRQNIRNIQYPDPFNSGYNEKLWNEKEKFIDAEVAKVQRVQAEAVALETGPATNTTQEKGNIPEKQVLVAILHKHFQELNPALPNLEDLKPGMGPEFMQQLMIAIFKEINAKIFVNTSGSGGSVFLRPSGSAEGVWAPTNKKYSYEHTIPGGSVSLTLEKYFTDFPWEKFIDPSHVSSELDILKFKQSHVEKWSCRFLHVGVIHDYVKDFMELLKDRKDSKSFIEGVKNLIKVKGTGNNGGMLPWDLGAFYKNRNNGTSLQDKLMAEVDGGVETGWMFPAYVSVFKNGIEKFVKRYNPESDDDGRELRAVFNKLKASIPTVWRTRDSGGEFTDDVIVDTAWQMALWELFPTLKFFDYDPDALFSKWSMVTKYYKAKTIPELGNTEAKGRKTLIQRIERSIIPPGLFTNVMVELDKNSYDELTIQQIAKMVPKLKAAGSVNESEKWAEFYQNIVNKSGGNEADVQKHYLIVKVHDSSTNLGMGGLPIAIPRAYRKWSEQNLKPEYQHYTALTLNQVFDSGIDFNLVNWNTLTESPGDKWSNAANDSKWQDFSDATQKDAIFQPVSKETLQQKVMRIVPQISDFPNNISAARLRLSGFFKISRDMALTTDQYFRSQVAVSEFQASELTNDMGFAVLTKTTGRYAPEDVTNSSCNVFPDSYYQNAPDLEKTMPTCELWLEMYRAEVGEQLVKMKNRRGKEVEKKMTAQQLFETKDTALIREYFVTPVTKRIREAADFFYDGKKKMAFAQMILETFLIAYGAYLDQYAYLTKSKGLPMNLAALDNSYGQLKTISGEKPLNFADRQIILAAGIAQLTAFQESSEFGFGVPEKSIFKNVTPEYLLGMMKKRGLIGTPEQAVCDFYYFENTFKKKKAGVASAGAAA